MRGCVVGGGDRVGAGCLHMIYDAHLARAVAALFVYGKPGRKVGRLGDLGGNFLRLRKPPRVRFPDRLFRRSAPKRRDGTATRFSSVSPSRPAIPPFQSLVFSWVVSLVSQCVTRGNITYD